MLSKKRHEGYLMIDNRNNEGVPQALIRASNPAAADLPPSLGVGLFEAPTITCSHCQVIVVLNPLRNRERPFCMKCNHYICDGCGAIMAQTKACKPFREFIEEVQEQAVRAEQLQQAAGGSIILPTAIT